MLLGQVSSSGSPLEMGIRSPDGCQWPLTGGDLRKSLPCKVKTTIKTEPITSGACSHDINNLPIYETNPVLLFFGCRWINSFFRHGKRSLGASLYRTRCYPEIPGVGSLEKRAGALGVGYHQ
jgi:hypothetical protein